MRVNLQALIISNDSPGIQLYKGAQPNSICPAWRRETLRPRSLDQGIRNCKLTDQRPTLRVTVLGDVYLPLSRVCKRALDKRDGLALAGDVILQLANDKFLVRNDGFHHIADGNQADEALAFHHR
jgi:hypothetical protein